MFPYSDDMKVMNSQGQVYYRESTNSSLLIKAMSIINTYYGTSGFIPDILLIATWLQLPDDEGSYTINGTSVTVSKLTKLFKL